METIEKKLENQKLENYVNWFEIPVFDLNRAVTFYNQIYDIEMEVTETNGYAMAFFPVDSGIGGALIKGPGCIPSEIGALIYLNAGNDMQQILNNIEKNGGRIIMEKTEIEDDAGHFALFIDSEGNKLALHSKKEATPTKTKQPQSKLNGKSGRQTNSKSTTSKSKVSNQKQKKATKSSAKKGSN